MSWLSILGDLSIWIILMPAITGLILFRRLDKDSKIIFVVVIFACIPQVLKAFMDGTWTLNTIYNVYTPIEFTVYWIFFRQKITSTSRKKMLDVMAVLFAVVSVYFIYNNYNNFGDKFLSEWVVWSDIFQVSGTGICLLEYYYSDESVINSAQPFFWFLIAIIGYASCTAVYFSLFHFIKNQNDFINLKAIHHIFNILLYVFFTIGFLKNSKFKYQS